MKEYKVIALIGKSAAGKDYIYQALLNIYPNINGIISHTTRPPREGEIDGVNYHFVTEEEFKRQIDSGEMMEYSVFRNWYYGSSKAAFSAAAPNLGVFNVDGIYTMLEDESIDLEVYYVTASDVERLVRQLRRVPNPDIKEIFRRYDTDAVDFEFIDFDYIELPNNNEEEFKNSFNILCERLDKFG